MQNQLVTIMGSILILLVQPAVLLSQPIEQSTPDPSGDYYSNNAPQKGTVPHRSFLMPGSLWQVVAPTLNCRRAAGISNSIVQQFQKGDIIQAEVGRGGADEVLLNAKDRTGKPWMPVRGIEGRETASANRCYVRANSRYIKPLSAIH